MNPCMANAFPVAGVWMYTFMAIVGSILIPIFPFILRRRRRRAQKELHDRIEKAKADILKDGVVAGPKGPYVPHVPWGVGTEVPPPHDTRPPKAKAYHGGPWP